MPIAIQEDMLTGSTMLEKFEHARALGAAGIEFWGAGLVETVPQIVEAMLATGVRAASVNHGRQSELLSPDPAERERALAQLRQSITCACDLGAAGVVFVPHFNAPILPDLSPWMTAAELEVELLYTHLRTLSDFADAMGVELYVEPINRYETHLLNRLEQAAAVTRRLKRRVPPSSHPLGYHHPPWTTSISSPRKSERISSSRSLWLEKIQTRSRASHCRDLRDTNAFSSLTNTG